MKTIAKFRVLVKTTDDPTWTGNGLRFDTKTAAKKYAADLTARWTAVTATKIVKTTDVPLNTPTDDELKARIAANYRGNVT